MGRKRYSVEDIIHTLREADVLLAQGKPVAEVCRAIAVTEVAYYRWRKEYGGLQIGLGQRLKELEQEHPQVAPVKRFFSGVCIWRRIA